MIFYDGTYRLQRRNDKRTKHVSKWANAWRIRIINFSISQPEVKHLKPYAIIATETGKGIFKTTCAESLGKRICRDFNLDINEILWIEQYPDEPVQMYVATFTPKSYSDYEIFYSINWRPIRPNELEAINRFISEAENI